MTGTAAVLSIVAVSIALMLVRPRGIAEVWWVSGGALLLVTFRLLPLSLAATALGKGTDVYFFLGGMMLLSELAREHGVFDWLSSRAIHGSRRSPGRLFTTVYAVGTLVTIFMSNDATAVVLTPAILAAVRKAKVTPLPYLFVCAFIANAASFVLPISNPANLVVFDGAMPSLGRWLSAFALPSVLSILTTYLVLRIVFRRELRGRVEEKAEEVPLSAPGRSVLVGLALISVVLLVASARSVDLGLPTLVAALVVTAAVSGLARKNPLPLARHISWSTLLLVGALFMLVEAVDHVGALEVTRALLARVAALPRAVGMLTAGFTIGVGNNVVNNLPLGLIAGATLKAAPPPPAIAHAVLLGVDLGPNLAVTGSLATILWLIALRKEQIEVSFWQFFKLGAVVMPTALAAALLGSLATGAFDSSEPPAATTTELSHSPEKT